MTDNLRKEILENFRRNRIPEDWDGHELRELLFVMAERYRSHIMQIKGNQRRRNFDNTILVNNL
jgi:hypothetical protein